jgi:hypothetical protein
MDSGDKKAAATGQGEAKAEANATSARPYEAPRLRHLGSVRALTLGGTGSSGDGRSRSGTVRRGSSREFKEDIHYLTADERSQLAREVLGIKLATYDYKQEMGEGPGRHLGFILEDAPNAPFVRKDEKVVDVYGFAAGIAAVVQEQQETIRRLERELAELRARVGS